jgi:hypothetical protein
MFKKVILHVHHPTLGPRTLRLIFIPRTRGRGAGGRVVGGNDATTAHAYLCPTRLGSGLRNVRATQIYTALRERAQLRSRARRDAAAREGAREGLGARWP